MTPQDVLDTATTPPSIDEGKEFNGVASEGNDHQVVDVQMETIALERRLKIYPETNQMSDRV